LRPLCGADVRVIVFVNFVISPGTESLICPSPSRSAFSVSQPRLTGTVKSTIFPARVSLKLTGVPSSLTPL
jgi:hypothetical protein